MLSRDQLATFLHYGFFPVPEEGYEERPWARLKPAPVPHRSEDEWVQAGLEAFRAGVQDLLRGGDHVLPLSGGVDSRFLLGMLLEAGLGPRLQTVTFGLPGSFDFEIAAQVARVAGVAHDAVDLSRVRLEDEDLQRTVRAAPWSHVLEAAYNHLLPRRFGADAIFWSGYMANSMSGIDVAEPSDTWSMACEAFAEIARIVKSVSLIPADFDPVSVLPRAPLLEEGSCLTYYEQLFMFLRHARRNERTLLPSGFEYLVPFRHPSWVEFSLRLPRSLRLHQRLYYLMAPAAFPKLFALPTKNNLGLPLGAAPLRVLVRRALLKLERDLKRRWPRIGGRSDPKLNYDDYDLRLREDSWMRAAVNEALDRLEARELIDWVDVGELRRLHTLRRANRGDALLLLTSLELNLRALEERQVEPPPAIGAEAALEFQGTA